MAITIDERVTILDENDGIAATRGYDPACYEDIKIRRYVVETSLMGFSFSVNKEGGIVRVTQPQALTPGVDVL